MASSSKGAFSGETSISANWSGRAQGTPETAKASRIAAEVRVSERPDNTARTESAEGAKAWPLHFAAVKPHLDTVYVKEPSWQNNTLGWGPVGEGAVDKGFYKLLKESDFRGPVSLHVEYLGHGDASLVPAVLAAIEKDFATLRSLLS